MTVTDQLDGDAQPTTAWRATVALRIPRNGSGELVAEAATRLETACGVEHATVETLAGLEPALAATVARVDITLEATLGEEVAVEDALASVAGMQRVEAVHRDS